MIASAPFRRFWWATAIDSVGDGAFAAAVPLLAVTITRDPRLVSLVAAATYLPWLLLSLPIGALVDRHDRIAVLRRAQVLQGAAAMALAVLAAFHLAGIADLVLLAFLLGVGEVAAGNAAQAALPDLVPAGELHRANGRLNAVMTAGTLFVGPPVGSLLFGVAVGLPFGLDAASFAVSAMLLATLPRRPEPATERVPVRRAVADGLRWLRADRLLRTLAVLLGINNFCGQFGLSTLVLLATHTLHVSVRGFGVLLAGAAIGAIVGGLVDARLVATVGETAALLSAMGGLAVVYLGIGLAPDAVLLGVFMALNGFFVSLWNVVTVSLRQALVPRELLGRVNSVYRMLGWGFMPLGALVGGVVADRFGLRAPYAVASGIRAMVFVLAVPVLVAALNAARAPRAAAGRPG